MSLYTVDIGELADCEIEADRMTIGGRNGDLLCLWRGEIMVGCFTKWESVHKDGKWRVCGEAQEKAERREKDQGVPLDIPRFYDVYVAGTEDEWALWHKPERYATCHYSAGRKKDALFAQRLAVAGDVQIGDKLRITVEKLSK